MDGFEEPDGLVPQPLVAIRQDTRERMKRVVAAMIHGATPEAVADGLERGFEPDIEEFLSGALEDQEASDYVDVLLSVLQAPAPVGV